MTNPDRTDERCRYCGGPLPAEDEVVHITESVAGRVEFEGVYCCVEHADRDRFVFDPSDGPS